MGTGLCGPVAVYKRRAKADTDENAVRKTSRIHIEGGNNGGGQVEEGKRCLCQP